MVSTSSWFVVVLVALVVDSCALVHGRKCRDHAETWAFWSGLLGLVSGLSAPLLFLVTLGSWFDPGPPVTLILGLAVFALGSLASAVSLSVALGRRVHGGSARG